MIYTDDIIGYQWDVFIKSIALGVLLGGCYDFFRVIRTVFRFGKKLYIASDFIYCLWAGFLGFSFLLNENFGFLRVYIIIGTAAGFLAWYFTAGKVIMKAALLLRKVLWAVLKPILKLLRKIAKSDKNPLNIAKIFLLNFADRVKSLLKKNVKVVYNILCLNVSKAFSFCGGKAGKELEKLESNRTKRTEEGSFSQDCSYCVRNLSSLYADIDAGEHK